MEEIGLERLHRSRSLSATIQWKEECELRWQPTRVLCSNDMTAIGLMWEAYDRGPNIPRDLSVVGFDDIRLSKFIIPPLTTVQMSQAGLAQIAFNALMNEVNRESLSPADSNTNRTHTSYYDVLQLWRRHAMDACAEPQEADSQRGPFPGHVGQAFSRVIFADQLQTRKDPKKYPKKYLDSTKELV